MTLIVTSALLGMSVLRKRKIKFFTVFANLVTFIARLGFRGGCDRYAWEIMK